MQNGILAQSSEEALAYADGCITRAERHRASYLQLMNIGIRALPTSLSRLKQLTYLDLSMNELVSLPDWIGELKRLEVLNLANNRLATLPESIGALERLSDLRLNDNYLKSLPLSLANLQNLRRIFLHNNQHLALPEEVLGATFQEVFDGRRKPAEPARVLTYYFRVHGGRRPLNEAKLILVGHGAVGKTSIVNRLVRNTFDRNQKKTQGIHITQWMLPLSQEDTVRLNIWDFGGQEIMHSTHQFFLTQRSLYILVLNGRQGHEDADAEYWLNLVQSFGGDSPVIIVLNKIHETPFDINRGALRQKFPVIREFIETDCEDATGIEKLNRAIVEHTDRLEHLRDAFPASWFAVKDRLAEMSQRRENYVMFDHYRAICAQHGETDRTAQELLACHLHNLGIALNYRDDPRLREMHILNPHWVTNGIYTILNAEYLAKRRGELHIKDIRNILDLSDYPPERHIFLLELMRKFELCFAFPDDDGRFLIPELLDKQQPPEIEEFPFDECVQFQYQYPTLPEGLLARFIVRSHVLSAGQPLWRTGVMLHFEGNRALVKADTQDRSIYIHVCGPTPGRRRLLTVIRTDFDHIHKSFTFEPRAIVPVPGHPQVLIPYQKLQVLESKGIRTMAEVTGEDVLSLNVEELLNGVDLRSRRRRMGKTSTSSLPIRVFYSYSHKDEPFRNELEIHLKILQYQGTRLSRSQLEVR